MRSLPVVGLLERSKLSVGEVRLSEAAVRVPAAVPLSAPGERMLPAAVVREPPMVPVPVRVAFAATVTGEVPKVPNKRERAGVDVGGSAVGAVAGEGEGAGAGFGEGGGTLYQPLVMLPAKVVEVIEGSDGVGGECGGAVRS